MIQGEKQEEQIPSDLKQKEFPILIRLNKRAVVFLFSLLVALTLFYISGCIQFFLDSNLHLILFFVTSVSIGLTIFSILEIITCIYYAINLKPKSLYLYALPFVLSMLAGLFLSMFTQSITILAQGF